MDEWKQQLFAATAVQTGLCCVPGCNRAAAVGWKNRRDCVEHFLDAAREYVDAFHVPSGAAAAASPAGDVDSDLLADCILRIEALFAPPAEFDRHEHAQLLRLLSACHALLRLSLQEGSAFATNDPGQRTSLTCAAGTAASR